MRRHTRPASHSTPSRILAFSFAPPALLSTNDAKPMPWYQPSISRPWMVGLAGPADFLQRLVKHCAEIAGVEFCWRLVVDQPSDVERHLLRTNEIATPDIRRDRSRDRRRRCRSAARERNSPRPDQARDMFPRASCSIHGRSPCRRSSESDTGRQKLRATRRRRAACAAGIGPDIDRHLAAQPDDDAVAVACDLQIACRLRANDWSQESARADPRSISPAGRASARRTGIRKSSG